MSDAGIAIRKMRTNLFLSFGLPANAPECPVRRARASTIWSAKQPTAIDVSPRCEGLAFGMGGWPVLVDWECLDVRVAFDVIPRDRELCRRTCSECLGPVTNVESCVGRK